MATKVSLDCNLDGILGGDARVGSTSAVENVCTLHFLPRQIITTITELKHLVFRPHKSSIPGLALSGIWSLVCLDWLGEAVVKLANHQYISSSSGGQVA